MIIFCDTCHKEIPVTPRILDFKAVECPRCGRTVNYDPHFHTSTYEDNKDIEELLKWHLRY